MNGKRYDRSRRNGFYLALAVCLVAIGVAAWSTYDAVNTYQNGNEADTVSRITAGGTNSAGENSRSYGSRTESRAPATPAPTAAPTAAPSPAPSAAPSARPSPSAAPARETDAPVMGNEPEEEMIPANGPLYERSSQMIWPIEEGEITAAYSAGAPVYSETMKDWRVHAGVDISAQAGQQLRACANGRVLECYSDSMRGNVLLIEHGDYEFSYCGVGENFLVQPGDVVTKGQVIGNVTAVPFETAQPPHLHMEVRRDGAFLDPQAVIDGQA